MQIISRPNQTFLDVVLTGAGTIEALFASGAANNTSITDDVTTGTQYSIPTANADITVLSYLSRHGIIIATARNPGGIGQMKVATTFVIG